MRVFYWCPFISNVATINAVIYSALSLKKFSNKKIDPVIINSLGEWHEKTELDHNNIKKINFFKINIIKYLPKLGFLRSRFSYIIVFFLTVVKLHNVLKKEKPEYLIVHLITYVPLFLLFFFNYKTKIILRISGYPKLNIFRKFYWNLISNKIHLVTAPTKLTMEYIKKQKIFSENKIVFLPDPAIYVKKINNLIKQKIDLPKDISKENSIISIGRLTKQKNQIFLIKNFPNLLKKYKDLNLFILGDGECKNILQKEIDRNNLNSKVFLLGHIKNIFPFIKNSKMFILTSRWEDPGFVLIEAAYMNKTVLSSDCPNGPKEILDNEKNGFLFESNSTASFLKKFDEIQKSEKSVLLKKKISFKKKIKEFTLLNHFNVFSNLLIDHEN